LAWATRRRSCARCTHAPRVSVTSRGLRIDRSTAGRPTVRCTVSLVFLRRPTQPDITQFIYIIRSWIIKTKPDNITIQYNTILYHNNILILLSFIYYIIIYLCTFAIIRFNNLTSVIIYSLNLRVPRYTTA